MNLVAKEYVTVQGATGGAGALVLSEFTGAAEELRDALLCNPFDVEGLAATISSRSSSKTTIGAEGSGAWRPPSSGTTSSPGWIRSSRCRRQADGSWRVHARPDAGASVVR